MKRENKTSVPLRESIPRLFNGGRTTMTTHWAPACSQVLPVKPKGVWARGIEAWARSRDRRNLEFRRWGSLGPSSVMSSYIVLMYLYTCICFMPYHIIDESMPILWTRSYLGPCGAVCITKGYGPFYFGAYFVAFTFVTLQRKEVSFVCNTVRCHWNAVKYNTIFNTFIMPQCRLSFDQIFSSHIFHISQLSYGVLWSLWMILTMLWQYFILMG